MRGIECSLAELQGFEAATLAPSTLHLAWDLFYVLAQDPITIFMDSGTYPISRWGVQRAVMRGAAVRKFPHYDAAALERGLRAMPRGTVPVIVSDSFCPKCGRLAPLGDYLALARNLGGLFVGDDTQALGVLGHSPSLQMPYGQGGGGSFCWSGIRAPEALVFSSLAKGFGVPIAVLAGSRSWINAYKEKSFTRVHCSQPSTAMLRAAEHALEINRHWGEILRQRLVSLVRRFREQLAALGILACGGLFPIQTLALAPSVDPINLHATLAKKGLRTVLRHGQGDRRPRVTLLLTARHSPRDIDRAATAIGHAVRSQRKPSMTVVDHDTKEHRDRCTNQERHKTIGDITYERNPEF